MCVANVTTPVPGLCFVADCKHVDVMMKTAFSLDTIDISYPQDAGIAFSGMPCHFQAASQPG